jgi:hypothetical protein
MLSVPTDVAVASPGCLGRSGVGSRPNTRERISLGRIRKAAIRRANESGRIHLDERGSTVRTHQLGDSEGRLFDSQRTLHSVNIKGTSIGEDAICCSVQQRSF